MRTVRTTVSQHQAKKNIYIKKESSYHLYKLTWLEDFLKVQ